MTVARQVAWNTIAQTLARAAVLGLAVVTTGLLTRYLGVAGYGDYIVVSVYILFFAALFDWGIPTMLAREIPRVERADDLVAQALGLRLALAVPVTLLAAGIAFLVYGGADEDRVRKGILLALPTILAISVSNTFIAVFQARLKMDRVAAAEIVAQATGAGLLVVLVLTEQSFYELVLATVLGSVLFAMLVTLLVRRLVRTSLAFDLEVWGRLLRLSLPLGLAIVVGTIYFRADALLLSLLKQSEDVGIYGVAYRFYEMTASFPTFFLAPVFPLLSAAAISAAGLAEFTGLLQRSMDVLLTAAVLIVSLTLVLAPEMIHLVSGESFERSALPLRILIVGSGLSFVNSLFIYALVALDRQAKVLVITAVALVLNIALNLVFIPRFSYNAAAAIATGSQLVTLAATVFLVWRYSGFSPSGRVPVRLAVAGVAVAGVLLLFPLPLAASLVLGTGLYAVMLLLLRVDRELQLRELLRRA